MDSFDVDRVLDACDSLSRALLPPLSRFLTRRHLQARILRELGSLDPFQFSRPDHRQPIFERCCPLGVVAHVTPDPWEGICAMVDGVLTGNVNLLVVEKTDHPVAQFAHSLLAHNAALSRYLSVSPLSSLSTVLAQAQAVNAWGDIGGIRELTPVKARFQPFPNTSVRQLCWSGALSDYVRRVTCEPGLEVSTFAELQPWSVPPPAGPVMRKEDFQSREVPAEYADLFFRSGGSCGEPKLSVFTYHDYHLHHQAQAAGLFAAGLDPGRDRCMNLFVAGGLYGGFVSFFTVLETLNAVQFPMAAYADTQLVAETIAAHGCNVLLGMPSYLLPLFCDHAELLQRHRVVEKIFYGGEPLHENQRRYLEGEFGVEIVRSSGYGSVDAGPIGYQCSACAGAVYHLHSRLHTLELLDLEKDQPVSSGLPGRIVLTSLARAGQHLDRYDLGDVARAVPGPCSCGRMAPRFELLGRHGDVFRVGGGQFNYRKFVQVLGVAGEIQLVLSSNGIREELLVRVSPATAEEHLRQALLDGYPDLCEMVVRQERLNLRVEAVGAEQLERSPNSGKLLRVLDHRL